MNIVQDLENSLAREEAALTKAKKEYKIAAKLCPAISLIVSAIIGAVLTFFYYPNIAEGIGNSQSVQIVFSFGIFYIACIAAITASQIIQARQEVKSHQSTVDSIISKISGIKEQIDLNIILGEPEPTKVRRGLFKTV